MLGRIRGEVHFKEPLSFHTGLRIGGPADVFVVPRDIDDVRRAVAFAAQEGLPVITLGAGTGVLAGDRGVRGVVLRLGGCLESIRFLGDEAIAGAGVRLSVLIHEAAARSLGGLERFVAVPATVGGALSTAAQVNGATVSELVSVVYMVHRDGTIDEIKVRPRGALGRRLEIPPDAVVLGARFSLRPRPQREVRHRIQVALRCARQTTPLALATAGHVWRDPPGGSAAQLIQEAGLAGHRLGGVEISRKHPNFLVNRGRATSRDVLALMTLTRERVEQRFGFTLEPRMRMLGR